MLRFIRLFAGTAAIAMSSAAFAADHSLVEDAKAFGARESVRSVEVSPSGSKLLFVGAGPGRLSTLQYVDLAAKGAKTLAASDGDPESLYWCGFGTDTQIVCKLGAMSRLRAMSWVSAASCQCPPLAAKPSYWANLPTTIIRFSANMTETSSIGYRTGPARC